MPAAQKVTPPASVQETLRSIAENAARWTDIAGVSLARSSGGESTMVTTDPLSAEPAVEAAQSGAASPRASEVEVSAARGADAPLQEAAEAAPNLPPMQPPVETTRIEAASETPIANDSEPVVQWPIEPPIIQAPLTVASAPAPTSAVTTASAASAVTPASAQTQANAQTASPLPAMQHAAPASTATPFQTFAAQFHASSAQADVPPPLEEEPTPDHTAPPAPSAEAVIDKPLAPWEARIEAVAPAELELAD